VVDGKLTRAFATFCLFLFVILTIFYWPWLSGNAAFYKSDLTYYFEPFLRFICDAYRQGRLPLWNPYLYCGMSQLAVPSPGMFYPLVVCFFLPFSIGTATFLVLHQLIAGAGMFLLISALGWGVFAASVAGIALALCGYMLALQDNFTLVATISWMPLLLYLVNGIDSTFTTKNILRAIGTAVVTAMMIAAGRPELSVPAALIVAIFALGTAYSDYRNGSQIRSLVTKLGIFSGSIICGILLAAPIVLPAMEWARISPRSKGLEPEWVLMWSANWYDLLSMILAHPFGDLTELGNKYLNMVASRLRSIPYLYSTYLGPTAFTLALWSLFDRRWQWRWPVVALGVAATLMAVGKYTPVAEFLVRLSPVFAAFRYPVKLIIFPTFAVIVLAARGAMWAAKKNVSKGAQLTTALFWLGCLICGAIFMLVPSLSSLVQQFPWNVNAKIDLTLMHRAQIAFGQSFLIAAGLGLLACGIYLIYSRNKINQSTFQLAMLAVLTANLVIPAYLFLRHETVADFYTRESPIAYLIQQVLAGDSKLTPSQAATQRITQRVLPLMYDPLTPSRNFIDSTGLGYQKGFYLYARQLLLPNSNVDYQVPYSFGYEAAEVGQYKRLFEHIISRSSQNRKHIAHELTSDLPMARFCKLTGTSIVLTQCYVNSPEHTVPLMDRRYFTETYEDKFMNLRMYKPVEYLPRAYFATALKRVTFDEFLKAMLDQSTASLPKETFLDNDLPASIAPPINDSNAGKIKFDNDAENKVALTVDTIAPQFLVLSDQFYPGWQVTIDGQPSVIYRANYFARAVWVPAGHHQVSFAYRPQSLIIGLCLTATILSAFIATIVFCLRRRTTLEA
jgi:Bacterial membrane protein YfhO